MKPPQRRAEAAVGRHGYARGFCRIVAGRLATRADKLYLNMPLLRSLIRERGVVLFPRVERLRRSTLG